MTSAAPDSPFKRLLLVSPGILALFLLIPALFITTLLVPPLRFVRLPYNLVMLNNLAFALVTGARFVHGLMRLNQEQQYGPDGRPAGAGTACPRSAADLRQALTAEQYRFNTSGTYAEKRTPAFLAGTVLYGGLMLTVLTGSIDFARQFSSVVLLGVGNPLQLTATEGVTLGKGFLSPSDLPKLQVKEQILPNKQWPFGASDIAIIGKDGSELARKTVTWSGEPLRYSGYEFHMGRFLYDVDLNIGTTGKYLEFEDIIKLQPAWGDAPLPPPYTHKARFKGKRGTWNALYDPATKALHLDMTNETGNTAGTIVFQKDSRVTMGGFIVGINSMGNWSEIHVVHTRHMAIIIAGAVIALVGILLRLLYSPQRLWLEESAAGCRVWTTGRATQRIVNNRGEN